MMPSRMPPAGPMTLERLKTILDAYGAQPGRWPAEERAAAEALVARSAEARTALAEAEGLDGALAAWQPEVPEAALARLTATTAFPPPQAAPARAGRPRTDRNSGNWWGGRLQAALWPRAAAFAGMAMLGIAVGLSVDPAYSDGTGDDAIATIDGDVISLDVSLAVLPANSQTRGE